MNRTRGEIIACGLWVAATSLMAFGTLDSERAGHTSPFLAWGVFVAIVACVPSVWCIVGRMCFNREEATLEDIIEVVDALHEGKRALSRLH